MIDLGRLQEELERDEGRRHVPYRDQFGNWTCGIGHLMGRGPFKGEYWSDEKISTVFRQDAAAVVSEAGQEPWFIKLDSDRRRRALLNMLFNLGLKGLKQFHTFLSLLEQGRYKEAGEDLKGTKWFKEVPARANRIIKMISDG